MQHFYVWHFSKAKRVTFSIIIVIALISALFLFIPQTSFYPSASKVKHTALTKGDSQQSNFSLTFNISWGEEKVFEILDTLAKYDIRATFFVSGEWAEKHPHILEAISDGKHELGMLGYRYKSYLEQDIDQVRKDLLYAKEVFEKMGYKSLEYVRTPSGHFNKEILALAKDLGFTVIHWSVNPNDWENPGVDVIKDTVLEQASNGDIVLLHASDAAKQTGTALDSLIPGLQKKGLHFSTISELLYGMTAEEELVE